MVKRTTIMILNDAEETLETAQFGLEDFINGPPERRMSGLRNLIVFGRAVTNVLQNLRSTEPSFDEWYTPHQNEMKEDKNMKRIYQLRSIILKQGTLRTSKSLHIKSFSNQDMHRFGPPPKGSVRFFIGDQLGGTGWEILLPDGSKVKYYVELPQDIGEINTYFDELVTTNESIDKYNSVEDISKSYIEYLTDLVKKAKTNFL